MARLTRAAARRLILVLVVLSLAVATSSAQGSRHPTRSSSRVALRPPRSCCRRSRLRSTRRVTPRRDARLVIFNAAPRRHRPVLPLGPGTPADGRQRRVVKASRSGGSSRSAGLVQGESVSIRLGDWPSGLYFARSARSGRPCRLRTVHPASAPSGAGGGRRRPADDDVAGVQPARRRRRRPGRLLVRRMVTSHGAARPTVSEPRRAVQLPALRPPVPALACLERPSGRLLLGRRPGAHVGRRACRAYRLMIFPGHHEYVTTREYDASSATAIWVAT